MATVSADPACCLTDSRSKISPISNRPAALLTDSDIVKIVERKLRSNNFRILHWSLDNLGEVNGYLGSYYTLSVTVKFNNKSKELKFFAKTPPPSTSPQYEFLVRYNTFNKEMIVYSELVPTMGIGNSLKWIPDYYLGKNNAIMVLEDAKQSGYVTPDKFVPYDEDHCIWVTKALCILHSRSLILDEKLRRSTGQTVMDLYGHLLEEMAFVQDDVSARKYLASCTIGAHTMVDLIEGLSDVERTTVKNRISRWVDKIPQLLKTTSKYRNVMCHRDVWANNMMFKRDSTGKPIGCYLVDYQFLRYSPPAIDFVFCLYLTTDRDTRRRCFDSLVEIYCDTMRRELADEGLNVDDCLPRADFIESCDMAKQIALIFSVTNMQIMLLTKQASEKYFVKNTDQLEYVLYGDQRSELVLSQCKAVKAYQTRIIEIIEEIKDHLPDNPPNC
ncbi:uncharacterized protein LOC122404119 [Colletes gigas]|uniref:uncharacterized protein LOC122404119 n=1 Tax=Colletes gigas TaxID=935657 RepID=UPI001C9BA2C4|nr:uncharacterized protein LOC122404119 [Colletes gigas]